MRVTLFAIWLIVSRTLAIIGQVAVMLPFGPWLLARIYQGQPKNRKDQGLEVSLSVWAALCIVFLAVYMACLGLPQDDRMPIWIPYVAGIMLVQLAAGRFVDNVSQSWHSVRSEAAERIQSERPEQETLLRPASPDTSNLVRPA